MFFKSFVTLAVAVSAALAQNLTINTPATLTECVPVQLSWTSTQSPYYLSVIPGGQVSAAALVSFGQVDGTTYTWTVNITSGTSVTIEVVDSSGVTAYTSPVTIGSGSTSCLTSSSGSTGSSSAVSSDVSSAASSASAAGSSAISSATSAEASATATGSKTSAASSTGSASHSSTSTSATAAASSSAAAIKNFAVGSVGALFLGAIGVVLA